MRLWQSGVLIWLMALLAACSSLPLPQEGVPEFVGATPSKAQPFQRQGRFAVHAQQYGEAPEAVQGGFSWYDDGEQMQLELRNPLGQTMAQIQVSADGAWLSQEQGQQRFAASADALVREVFQQPIPVEGLRYWLRGHLSAGATAVRLDEQQRVHNARDLGWRLELERYDELGPGRLLLVYQHANQRITVRLVIDSEPA